MTKSTKNRQISSDYFKKIWRIWFWEIKIALVHEGVKFVMVDMARKVIKSIREKDCNESLLRILVLCWLNGFDILIMSGNHWCHCHHPRSKLGRKHLLNKFNQFLTKRKSVRLIILLKSLLSSVMVSSCYDKNFSLHVGKRSGLGRTEKFCRKFWEKGRNWIKEGQEGRNL